MSDLIHEHEWVNRDGSVAVRPPVILELVHDHSEKAAIDRWPVSDFGPKYRTALGVGPKITVETSRGDVTCHVVRYVDGLRRCATSPDIARGLSW